MPAYREKLIRDWAEPDLNLVNRRLEMLDRCLYATYEPTQPPRDSFDTRFTNWLRNLDSDDEAQKTLFRMAADLFYVGPDEFRELYRLAYNGPIARWLIDEESIDITAGDAQAKLQAAVRSTWFCPITDSMRINSFYHVNNIPTLTNLRPDWRSIAALGSTQQVREYMAAEGLTRLVLLEDFVGGGSQIAGSVRHTATHYPNVKALVVPLLVCPTGLDTLRAIEQSTSVKVEPIIALPRSTFVSLTPQQGEDGTTTEYRDLALRTYGQVANNQVPGARPPYHPLGYPPHDPSGGLVVMFSNTPDNTLPLIHWDSTQWSSLFPRHRRV